MFPILQSSSSINLSKTETINHKRRFLDIACWQDRSCNVLWSALQIKTELYQYVQRYHYTYFVPPSYNLTSYVGVGEPQNRPVTNRNTILFYSILERQD